MTTTTRRLHVERAAGRRTAVVVTATVLALIAAACSSTPASTPSATTTTTASADPTTTPPASGLKTIDPAALQAIVDETAKELLVPGALVLLRTPQGEFVAASGTTALGEDSLPPPTPTSGSPRSPRR